MTIEDTLPNKASELIRVALRDLRAVENEPDRFLVDMSEWHRPVGDGSCVVCLAGSVVAKTLNVDQNVFVLIGMDGLMTQSEDTDGGRVLTEFSEDTSRKLKSLDDFRRGNAFGGMHRLMSREDFRDVAEVFDVDHEVCPYEDNREMFHADMNKMADWLEKLGY